jgi:RNA-directed DNA polymerase
MSVLNRMERDLGVPVLELARIAGSANHLYKHYTIPKRTGGERHIYHPAPRLKALQRWCVRAIIRDLPVSRIATGYRRGVSIRDNARIHAGSRFILKMDLKDFFPSICKRDLIERLQSVGLSTYDAEVVSMICFRRGALTIGAPSSPAISNAVMLDIDDKISAYCIKHGISATRYADDFTFSSNNREVLEDCIREVTYICEKSNSPKVHINTRKTSLIGKGSHQKVTGLTLTTDGNVSIGREKKREIRSLYYRRKNNTLPADLEGYLDGWLAYIKSVEPSFYNKLRNKDKK